MCVHFTAAPSDVHIVPARVALQQQQLYDVWETQVMVLAMCGGGAVSSPKGPTIDTTTGVCRLERGASNDWNGRTLNKTHLHDASCCYYLFDR